ncbi:MAG: hypothetical protein K2X81_08670 [Candidatus Obscuribacterales bacterium]|nr:hypothetical protein [Candidatus Obscuribacterales bacterium]
MSIYQLLESEAKEFDIYLQWSWPTHIEDALRRSLWWSLRDACEPDLEANEHTVQLRWLIACYPESPPAVLEVLSRLNDPKLLVRIAENPNTSSLTLSRLARHKSTLVRIAVAESNIIPFDVMKALAEDESLDVCYALAANPKLPSRYLLLLQSNENPYVALRAIRTLARLTPRVPEEFPLRFSKIREAE